VSTQVHIGEHISHKGLPHRVVRIVKSISLMRRDGKDIVVDEAYFQLKGPSGEIDFHELYKTEGEYKGELSEITAPDFIPWGK
jgi:hypothetical protein